MTNQIHYLKNKNTLAKPAKNSVLKGPLYFIPVSSKIVSNPAIHKDILEFNQWQTKHTQEQCCRKQANFLILQKFPAVSQCEPTPNYREGFGVKSTAKHPPNYRQKFHKLATHSPTVLPEAFKVLFRQKLTVVYHSETTIILKKDFRV